MTPSLQRYIKTVRTDVDRHLRGRGFTFFDLIGHHCIGRAESPVTAQQCPGLYPLWGQLIEGHGIYFKDPIDLEARGQDSEFTVQKLLKLICFAEIYGQAEVAFELLGWLQRRLSTRQDAEADRITRVLTEATQRYREILGA